MTPSANVAEFEQTASSRPAVHKPLRRDSFNQHRTTAAAELEQIDRRPLPRIHHDMSAAQSSMARPYRKQLHAVILFLVTTFGGYVQVEYQSRTKSPFDDDHATVMAAIFVNLCLYAVSLIAEFKIQSEEPYLAIIKTFGPLLGFLVLVLLLTMLVPLLDIIASIIWGLSVLKTAIMSYPMVVQCLSEVFSGIRQYLVSESSHSQEVHVNASPVQSRVDLNV